MSVKAKKHLGQHFLTSQQIAFDIADTLQGSDFSKVFEIGPGMGIMTKELIELYGNKLSVIDIDSESIVYLKKHFKELGDRIIEGDFLEMDIAAISNEPIAIIGNYPYNISTQIMFKVLDFKDQIIEVSGMFQKEVAVRFASEPGNKQYGLTSVLLQTWYDIEYLFSVGPEHFNPPPKVNSGVMRMIRNSRTELPVPEKFYKRIVKTSFGQRRKTLRNSLKGILNEYETTLPEQFEMKRPEQLGVEEFITLATHIYKAQ